MKSKTDMDYGSLSSPESKAKAADLSEHKGGALLTAELFVCAALHGALDGKIKNHPGRVGHVLAKAKADGNSYKNDTCPVILSQSELTKQGLKKVT